MDSKLREIRDRIKLQAELTDNGMEHQVILSQDDYIYLWEQTEKVNELEDKIRRTEDVFITNCEFTAENEAYKKAKKKLETIYDVEDAEHPFIKNEYIGGYLQGLGKAIDFLGHAEKGELE